MKGSTLPRVYTQPLPGRRQGEGVTPWATSRNACPCRCGLSPATSRGFEVIRWAKRVLGIKLNPWQRWLLIHALELDESCTAYRFRTVLVLVARQNGKTLVKAVLTLWRMFEQNQRYLVGTAQDLSQAREVMNEVLVPMIQDQPALQARFDPDAEDSERRVGIWHKTLNDEYFRLDSAWRGGRAVGPHGPRYLIKALNRKAGRGLAGVSEVNIDELREQRDFLGWSAISKVVMAIAEAQTWCMSNAGDRESAVLNHLRGVALAGTDPTLFHAEWSAAEGCALDDEREWAHANPSLGYTLPIEAIRSAYRTDPPNVFRTEVLCQFVDVMNTAVDVGAWTACADPMGAAGVEGSRPAIVVERSMESEHIVAAAAATLPDGRLRVSLVGDWQGTTAAGRGLTELKSVFRPRAVGWFPNGPGATLGAVARKSGGVPIRGAAVAEACMTFADCVDGRRILHSDDPLLNMHVTHAGAITVGSAWIFDRGPGETHAAWAAAGAVHLALNEPEPKRGRRTVIVSEG